MFFYLTTEGMYGYVRTEGEIPEGATILDPADYPGPFWFQTPYSYGMSSNADNVPPNTIELITKAEYEALVAAALAEQEAQAEIERQAAYQRYRDAYAEARTAGMGQMIAMALAGQVGIQPPDFDPTWPPAP